MVDIPQCGFVETCSEFPYQSQWTWGLKSSRQHAYVTLKMYEHDSSHGQREKQVYEHLRNTKSSHTGSLLVRRAIDDFEISCANNNYSYQCLVHPPLAMSLCELRNRTIEKLLPEDLLKPILIHILLALDFLHTEAKIVHTGIVSYCCEPSNFFRIRLLTR